MKNKTTKIPVHIFKMSNRKNACIRSYVNLINEKELIKLILRNIPYKKATGFAGFRNKIVLKKHLQFYIYDYRQNRKILKNTSIINESIIDTIEDTIKLCSFDIRSGDTDIFVFPTFNNFIRKMMHGVAGYSPWKNVILIYISPNHDRNKYLQETICHEFAHAVSLNYNERLTILDNLIFEGLAEHFKEHITSTKKSDWTKSLSKEESFNLLNRISNKLRISNEELNRELFFGSRKYKRWSGYALGYNIVGEYLEKQKKLDWNSLLATNPIKMFESVYNILPKNKNVD